MNSTLRIQIIATAKDAVRDIRALRAEVNRLEKAMVTANRSISSSSKQATQTLRQGYNASTTAINSTAAATRKAAAAQTAYGRAAASAARSATAAQSRSGTSPSTGAGGNLTSAGRASQQLGRQVSATNKALSSQLQTINQLPRAVDRWGKSMQWTGRVLETRVTLPLVALGASAAFFGFQFEKAITRTAKVYGNLATEFDETRDVPNELALIEKAFLALSSTLGISAEEIANTGAIWAQAGAEGENLLRLTRLTSEVSILGDLDNEAAAQGLLTVMQAYQLDVQGLTEAMAVLNVVENETAAGLGDLIEVFEKAGAAARTAGVTVEELAGFAAALIPAGGSASEVGTALRTTISRVAAPVGAAAAAINSFGINVESTYYKSLTFTQQLAHLAEGYDTLTQSQKTQFAVLVAGRRQFARFQLLMEDQISAQSRYKKVIEATSNAQGNAAAYQKELSALLSSDSQGLAIAWNTIKNALIEAILPVLPTIVSAFKTIAGVFTAFNKLAPETKKLIVTLAIGLAVLGPILGYLGAFVQLFGRVLSLGLSVFKVFGLIGKALTFIVAGGLKMAGGLLIGIGKFIGFAVKGIGLVGGAFKTGFAAIRIAGVAAGLSTTAAFLGPLLLVVGAVAVAVALIVSHFDKLPSGIQQRLAGITDLFRNAWQGVLRITSEAIGLLPQPFATALRAVIRVVRKAALAIYEWLSWINPFARHSPSLVDQVQDGAKVIAKQYQGLARRLGVGVKVPIIGMMSSHASKAPSGTPAFAEGGQLPTSKVGSGLKVNRARAIVGEASRGYPEYVIPTDPKYKTRAQALLGEAMKRISFATGGILPGATRAAESLRSALTGVKEQQRSSNRSDLIQIAIDLAVESGPVAEAIDRLHELDRILEGLQVQIDRQQAVVDEWERALDSASDAVSEAQDELSSLEDAVRDLEDQLTSSNSRLQDWLSAPIEGTYAFTDALFANDQAQKSSQLEMLKLEQTFSDAGWTIDEVRDYIENNAAAMDDAQDSAVGLGDAFNSAGLTADEIGQKINALNTEIEGLRGQSNDLRLSGAGSDVLAGLDAQIAVADQARKSLSKSVNTGGSAAPPQELISAITTIDDLEAKLEDLARRGQIVDLEEALALEPLQKAIEDTQRIAEESFADIMAGIAGETKIISDLESQIETANAAVERQQTIVEGLISTRDGIEASYNAERDALQLLQNDYDDYEAAARSLRTELDYLQSAHSDLIDTQSAGVGGAGGGGFGTGADFDIPGGFGADLGGAGDIQALTERWINESLGGTYMFDEISGTEQYIPPPDGGLFGDFDPFEGIRKEYEKFKGWWSGTIDSIGAQWDRLVDRDWDFPGDTSSWETFTGKLDVLSTDVLDLPGLWDSIKLAFEDVTTALGPLTTAIGDLWTETEEIRKLAGTLLTAWIVLEAFIVGILIRALSELLQLTIDLGAAWSVGLIEDLTVVLDAMGPGNQILNDFAREFNETFGATKLLVMTNWRDTVGTAMATATLSITGMKEDAVLKLGELAVAFGGFNMAGFRSKFETTRTVVSNVVNDWLASFTNWKSNMILSASTFSLDAFTSKFDTARDKIVAAFKGIGNGISFGGLRKSLASGINGGIGIINRLIGAVNTVSGKLGMGFSIGRIGLVSSGTSSGGAGSAVQFAQGGLLPEVDTGTSGPFTTNKARAIVGEGSKQFPEYVIPTDPKFRGRAQEFVMQAAQRVGLNVGPPQMASGGRVPMSSVPQFLTGGIISAAKKTFTNKLSGFTGSGLSGFGGKMTRAVMPKIINSAKDKVTAMVRQALKDLPKKIVAGIVGAVKVGGNIFFNQGGQLPTNSAVKMANGALVKGGRGGVYSNIGEGRHDELVVPLGSPAARRATLNAGGFGASGSSATQNTYHFNGSLQFPNVRSSDDVADFLEELEAVAS